MASQQSPRFVRPGVQADQHANNSRNTLFIILCSGLITTMIFEGLMSLSPSLSSPVTSSLSTISSKALSFSSPSHPQSDDQEGLSPVRAVHQVDISAQDHDGTHPDFQNLLIYNRPAGTGSGTIARAMNEAYKRNHLSVARCFGQSSNNEMTLRTVINRDWVHFYGCRLKITKARYKEILTFRGSNITFMTSTRSPRHTILSEYVKKHVLATSTASTSSLIRSIDNNEETLHKHVKQYRRFAESYAVGQIYDFHGADEDFELTICPTRYEQMASLRRIVARYEIVVDLDKPAESETLVEIVTGIRPDFVNAERQNVVLNDDLLQSKLVHTLQQIDVSNATCGLNLVHGMLSQQFNLIKDRLLQNRCFDEDKGTFRLCDLMPLRKENVTERTRDESFAIKDMLAEELKRRTAY